MSSASKLGAAAVAAAAVGKGSMPASVALEVVHLSTLIPLIFCDIIVQIQHHSICIDLNSLFLLLEQTHMLHHLLLELSHPLSDHVVMYMKRSTCEFINGHK